MRPRAAEYGYNVFSCRYGNIYSTRQLRQLFDEALGVREPILRFAETGLQNVIDLMRPNMTEIGFSSPEEAKLDRLYHLSRVREMVEQMQVFIFTLGLTETWIEQAADVVYGSHPGVFAESIDAGFATAVNLGYDEVVDDLNYVLDLIARHNQNSPVRVILTVSPVGLAATHQDAHVLMATSYSKSVLRAAAGKLAATRDNVDYFPSFEIFSLSQSFGQFLAEDLRDVNPEGVAVAMRAFEAMFLETSSAVAPRAERPAAAPTDQGAAERECDEIANAFFGRAG
jgi:hypothetical protein